jgi:hypothetical protein
MNTTLEQKRKTMYKISEEESDKEIVKSVYLMVSKYKVT